MDETERLLQERSAVASTQGAVLPPDDIEALLSQRSQQTGAPITAKSLPAEDKTQWGSTLKSAAINLPGSTWDVLKGIGQAVTHPSDTAGHIMDLAAGELSAVMPKSVNDFVDKYEVNPQSAAVARNTASNFNDTYKQGYGSAEGFKNKLANDPASVVADASTLFTGGASIFNKAGKLGQVLAKTGSTLNPLSTIPLAVKGGEKVADLSGSGLAYTLGSPLLTGVGGQTVKNAFNAGKSGKTDFWQNLSGEASMDDVVDSAKQNIKNMADKKSAAYKEGMINVNNDKSVLNFDGVDNAIKTAENKVSYNGQIVNKRAYQSVQEAKNAIDEWKAGDPNIFATPEGLDKLKRRIGDIQESLPFEENTARSAVGDIYNSVKNEISTQAPVYGKIMQDYSDASSQLSEITKAFSLGNNAAADTAIRKLQSVTRNNVNANYGNRSELAKILQEQGGNNIINALSGQAMNSWAGRGIGSHIGSAGALAGALTNPYSLAVLPFQSPKLVGAAAYGAGKTAAIPSKIAALLEKSMPNPTLEFIQKNGDKAKSLALLLQQMQQGNSQ